MYGRWFVDYPSSWWIGRDWASIQMVSVYCMHSPRNIWAWMCPVCSYIRGHILEEEWCGRYTRNLPGVWLTDSTIQIMMGHLLMDHHEIWHFTTRTWSSTPWEDCKHIHRVRMIHFLPWSSWHVWHHSVRTTVFLDSIYMRDIAWFTVVIQSSPMSHMDAAHLDAHSFAPICYEMIHLETMSIPVRLIIRYMMYQHTICGQICWFGQRYCLQYPTIPIVNNNQIVVLNHLTQILETGQYVSNRCRDYRISTNGG